MQMYSVKRQKAQSKKEVKVLQLLSVSRPELKVCFTSVQNLVMQSVARANMSAKNLE